MLSWMLECTKEQTQWRYTAVEARRAETQAKGHTVTQTHTPCTNSFWKVLAYDYDVYQSMITMFTKNWQQP